MRRVAPGGASFVTIASYPEQHGTFVVAVYSQSVRAQPQRWIFATLKQALDAAREALS